MLLNPKFNARYNSSQPKRPEPYCSCWHKRMNPKEVTQPTDCLCGEEHKVKQWRWQEPATLESSCVVLSENNEIVTFNPFVGTGTAVAKGDTPMLRSYHYYWEVKLLTEAYGTDIMVGFGSQKFDTTKYLRTFVSALGKGRNSYGLSYMGKFQCGSKKTADYDCLGFCKGSIIGIKLDMWKGTAEFYINRKSQGIIFYNIRRHSSIYPMVCSTTMNTSFKIVYASSWKASLMVDAVKILYASAEERGPVNLPPGLTNCLKTQFWLTMPSESWEDEFDSSDLVRTRLYFEPSDRLLPPAMIPRRHQVVPKDEYDE